MGIPRVAGVAGGDLPASYGLGVGTLDWERGGGVDEGGVERQVG
jgi:hypothetical protein